jgi:hypothetical protein
LNDGVGAPVEDLDEVVRERRAWFPPPPYTWLMTTPCCRKAFADPTSEHAAMTTPVADEDVTPVPP